MILSKIRQTNTAVAADTQGGVCSSYGVPGVTMAVEQYRRRRKCRKRRDRVVEIGTSGADVRHSPTRSARGPRNTVRRLQPQTPVNNKYGSGRVRRHRWRVGGSIRPM